MSDNSKYKPEDLPDYEELDSYAVWQDAETGESGVLSNLDIIGMDAICSNDRGEVKYRGLVVGFCPVPMIEIEIENGSKIWWRIDLCELSEPAEINDPVKEALYHAAKAVVHFWSVPGAEMEPAIEAITESIKLYESANE